MPSTITLSDTQNFIQNFVNWLDLTIGVNNEPLITNGNLTLQTLLSPPFAWSWNRTNVATNVSQGQQDFAINIADFGYLEKASVQMMAEITSVSVSNGVAVFTAANNFASLLANGSVPTQISGCTTSALNGTQTIQAATPTTFTCAINTSDLFELESGAEAAAGPIMSLEYKNDVITEAVEQDRPSFICNFTSSDVALSIAKTHTGNFTQGQTGATYQITVSNTGSAPTSGTVTVTEIPSSGLTFVSMSGTGWTINGMTATRSDVLQPGSSYPALTVTVNVGADASSPQVNQATVSGGGLPYSGAGSTATASDSTTVEPSGIVPYFNSPQNDADPVNFGYISPLSVTAGQYSSIQNTAPGDIRVGDVGVLFFVVYGAASGVTIDSVQDSLGNNYTPRISALTVIADNLLFAFSAPAETAVAIGDSFEITINVTGAFDAIERAFVNIGGISGVDQVAYATFPNNSTTALVAGPVTPTQPAALLSAMIADVSVEGQGLVSQPTGFIPAIRHGVDGRQLLPVFFTDYPSAAPTVPPGSYSVSWPVTFPDDTTGGAVALISFVVS